MLRLRFVNQVPQNAVNIAYAEALSATPKESVSMIDMSHKRVENLAVYQGGEFGIQTDTGRVDTQDIVLSPRSVVSQNIKKPAPLFYQYKIGRPGVDDLAIVSDSSESGPTWAAAKLAVLKTLQILDRNNNKIKGPAWDIQITGGDAYYNHYATLYLERLPTEAETFKLKYTAAQADGTVLPNHIETINARPIMRNTDGYYGDLGIHYDYWYLLTKQTDGFKVVTGSGSTLRRSDGLGVFYTGTAAYGQFQATGGNPATDVELWDAAAPGWVSFSVAGKTLAELAAEMNQAGLDYEVVALNHTDVVQLAQAGATAIYDYGRAWDEYNRLHVRYNENTRVRPLRPYNDTVRLPWYPRVNPGQFMQSGTFNGTTHQFLFKPQGVENQLAQAPYVADHQMDQAPWVGGRMSIVNERPIILDNHTIQLRRPRVESWSITIRRAGVPLDNTVEDYDSQNSVLFLSERLINIQDITVDYTYLETSYIYTGVDLNPTPGHSEDLLGKYIGVYMTPAETLGATPTSFERTIWHVVEDNVPDIIAAVAAIKFNTGESAEALLLGIYYVGSPSVLEDQQLTDTRTRGGGLQLSTEPTRLAYAREAEMFSDISAYNGEPFPPTAVIAEVPTEIFGTGVPQLRRNPIALPSGFHYPSGVFDQTTVQSKLDRYKAGGVLALLDSQDVLNE